VKSFKVFFFFRGNKLEETFQAETKVELYNSIFAKFPNAKVVKTAEIHESQILKKTKDFISKFLNLEKIDIETKIAFIEQFAIMVDSGINILEALHQIEKNNKQLKASVESLIQNLNYGYSLTEAFQRVERSFDPLTTIMIRLGDETGGVSQSLFKLKKMQEEIRDNRRKLKKALSYPRNILIALFIAIAVIINYVIPQFQTIFNRFGEDLPILTQLLINTELFFRVYGFYIFILTISSFLIFKYLIRKFERFKFIYHSFILKIPILKNLEKFSTLNRFTIVFAELLNAGVPIFRSIEISISMVENRVLREKFLKSYERINLGVSLYESFKSSDVFDEIAIQMIRTGENSGELKKMLNTISKYYKRQFDLIIENMNSLIEPFVLILMGTLVTILALGVFLPIWNLGTI
jgi:general secretion pathway protein F